MGKELLEKINKIIDSHIKDINERKEEANIQELKWYLEGRKDSLELLKIDLIAIL